MILFLGLYFPTLLGFASLLILMMDDSDSKSDKAFTPQPQTLVRVGQCLCLNLKY